MIRVKFTKWYPFTKKIPAYPDFKWDEIKEYVHDDQWLHDANSLITMGFYVAIHWSPDDDLITIMVDTTWFTRR